MLMLHRDLQRARRVHIQVLSAGDDTVRQEDRGIREGELRAVGAEGLQPRWAVGDGGILVDCEAVGGGFDFEAVEGSVVRCKDRDGISCWQSLEGEGRVMLLVWRWKSESGGE